jgi:hypothetical protein
VLTRGPADTGLTACTVVGNQKQGDDDMTNYAIKINGEVRVQFSANFSQCDSPIELDGKSTPFQVADARHDAENAAELLNKWCRSEGGEIYGDDEVLEVVELAPEVTVIACGNVETLISGYDLEIESAKDEVTEILCSAANMLEDLGFDVDIDRCFRNWNGGKHDQLGNRKGAFSYFGERNQKVDDEIEKVSQFLHDALTDLEVESNPCDEGPWTISSCKQHETHEGTLEEAIARAREINAEYQPAYGVEVRDANDFVHYSTECLDD